MGANAHNALRGVVHDVEASLGGPAGVVDGDVGPVLFMERSPAGVPNRDEVPVALKVAAVPSGLNFEIA